MINWILSKIIGTQNEREIKKICNKFKIKASLINIDAKFFIADSDQVLFLISKGTAPDEEIAVWLNTPFFSQALSFMFNTAVK